MRQSHVLTTCLLSVKSEEERRMKKTKTKVKSDIKKREEYFRKSLSAGDESEQLIDSFSKTSGFINSVELIRLRSPECGLPTVEVNGIPTLTMKDDGFEDVNGYIHVRIRPDTPRHLIHHYIDEMLNSYQSQTIPKENTRFRDEKITALEVWEQRRLRKSFPEIAKEMKIKEDAARKMFYSAYERLSGKKYDPAKYKKPEIKKGYIKRTCETCDKQPTCTDLCPDVIEFVDQNTSYQRESRTDEHCDANECTTNYVEDAMIEYLDSISHNVKK